MRIVLIVAVCWLWVGNAWAQCMPKIDIADEPCGTQGKILSFVKVVNDCSCDVQVTAQLKGGGAATLSVSKKSSGKQLVKACGLSSAVIVDAHHKFNCPQKQPEATKKKPDQEGTPAQKKKSPMEETLERQQQKSKGADAVDAANRAKAKRFTEEADAEMTDLKAEQEIACESHVEACQAEAKNDSCRAYCTNQAIEKCNFASPTIEQSRLACEEANRQQRWAAVAYSSATGWGSVRGAGSPEDAINIALAQCGQRGRGCSIAGQAFSRGCTALASCRNGQPGDHGFWWAGGDTEEAAITRAMEICLNHPGPNCFIRTVVCQ